MQIIFWGYKDRDMHSFQYVKITPTQKPLNSDKTKIQAKYIDTDVK